MPYRARQATGVGRLSTFASTDALIGVALVLLWTLAHAFVGIEHDARIYMGRALADIDPGVGRDLMFRLDGQSSFSIFRIIASMLAGAFGLGPTVLLLSLFNMVVRFAALVALARTLLPRRAMVLGLACACVLSAVYAPWNLIAAGESLPIPRPLAEAAVLAGLAALCRDRPLACAAWLLVAALFHPIMALPGFGVLLVVLGARDRRWLIAAAAASGGVIVAGALGLPLASRLMVRIDPAWNAILVERNVYLYVGRWPPGDALASTIVRGVTIGLAALWLCGPARIILLATLGIGVAGALASFVLVDLCGNLLVMQAQLWRALWLVATLAPLAAGLCLWHLPRLGPRGQIALALLAAGWLNLGSFPMGPLCALGALGVYVGTPRLSFRLGRRAVLAAWAFCAIMALIDQWIAVTTLLAVLPGLPVGLRRVWAIVWPLGIATVPVVLVASAWARWPAAVATRLGAAVAVAFGGILVASVWNDQLPGKADADAAAIKPDLVTMLASRPGPVLWTDGDEAWTWARRPNWNAQIQGSAIVFSRDLTMIWHARAQAVVAAGLASPYLLKPLATPASIAAEPLDPLRIQSFCRGFDHGGDADEAGPAWIVAPLDSDTVIPDGLAIRIWSPPVPLWRHVTRIDGIHWRRFDRYAVMPCARLPESAPP